MAEPRIAAESLERLMKIKKQHEENRKRYDTAWRECAKYTNPNMADWNDEPGQKTGKRPDDTTHIYDNTVQKASQTLTDGVQGYAFARNQAWFKLALEGYDDLSGEEAAWLQQAEKKMYSQFQKSNFYDEGRAFIKCCADFGTGIMLRIDDVSRGIPVYKVAHLKWCCIDENEYGEVDTLFRDFWLNPFQGAAQFGYEKLPQVIKNAYHAGSLTPYKFTQVILPPDRYDLDIFRREGRAYYTVYWADCERTKAIMDGWYSLRPFFAWRWSRNLDGDVWGVDAPGMLETPNVKQLNAMRADYNRMVQLNARPSFKATEGLEGKINIRPNGVTYLRSGQDFTPIMVSGKIDSVLQDMADLRRTINETYYTDFFLILSQNIERQKTATEVAGIQGEKAALLSAFYGRLTAEFLEPVLEDEFTLELLSGRIQPPPDSLYSEHIRIDMISPLAQMQKRYVMLGSSQQAVAEIAALVQLNPGVMDNLNLDQHVRNIADAFGLDKRVIIDEVDVQRMRQARAQQQAAIQQAAMQMEQAKVGAEVMGKIPQKQEQP
jgi:hypothetical protein